MMGLKAAPHHHVNEGLLTAFLCPRQQRHQRQVYSQLIFFYVIPFIQQCHPDGAYSFWPHLASAHYS